MSETIELPLFPVKTVLFPGQALSLHVFEERYKLMVNHCLEQEQPIGIVLIREGEETGEPAIPHDVGTRATILETDRDENGEIDVVAVGRDRFVISKILQQKPYIVARVEPLVSEREDSPRALALSSRARELLPKYVDALAQATGTLVQIVNVPEEPLAVAYLLALALQIEDPERQKLLATSDVSEMLAREMALLRRETAIWQYVMSEAGTQSQQKQQEDRLGYISLN